MFSFKKRLGTFAGWPKDHGVATAERLAIAGFLCLSAEKENLTVSCVYCSKTLECWERTDVPAKEHYLHMKKCPLFNMNKIESRICMFDGWDSKEARALARNGFVKYNLGDSDFIFCYKCGSVDRRHVCKRRSGCVYSVEKPSGIFFYSLIEGVHNEEVAKYVENKMYVPDVSVKLLRTVVDTARAPALKRIGEVIDEYVNRGLEEMERSMDKDIKKLLDEMVTEIQRGSLG